MNEIATEAKPATLVPECRRMEFLPGMFGRKLDGLAAADSLQRRVKPCSPRPRPGPGFQAAPRAVDRKRPSLGHSVSIPFDAQGAGIASPAARLPKFAQGFALLW